jgi:hypothetical protein
MQVDATWRLASGPTPRWPPQGVARAPRGGTRSRIRLHSPPDAASGGSTALSAAGPSALRAASPATPRVFTRGSEARRARSSSRARDVIRAALENPCPEAGAPRDGRSGVPAARCSGVEHSGSAWGRSGDDPGPIDRCLQPTILVSKNERPRLSRCTPRRIPHATRELSVHADELASASRQAISRALSSPERLPRVPLTSRRSPPHLPHTA